MPKRFDTYKYLFKVGAKIVYVDITTDLERREQELRQDHPTGYIEQVGRRTTAEAARKWAKAKASSVTAKYPDPQPPIGTGSVSRALRKTRPEQV